MLLLRLLLITATVFLVGGFVLSQVVIPLTLRRPMFPLFRTTTDRIREADRKRATAYSTLDAVQIEREAERVRASAVDLENEGKGDPS